MVVVFGAQSASADEDATGIVVRAPASWERDGPLLHLDFSLRPNAEGLGAEEDRVARIVELGRHARAVLAGSWWTTEQTARHGPGSALDVEARGWRAAVEVSYDLGPVRLGATAAQSQIDSRYERGTYTDIGLSLSKTVQLSRWMRGWISLSLGRRRWQGAQPPPGESDGTTSMLTIGTTFR